MRNSIFKYLDVFALQTMWQICQQLFSFCKLFEAFVNYET